MTLQYGRYTINFTIDKKQIFSQYDTQSQLKLSILILPVMQIGILI